MREYSTTETFDRKAIVGAHQVLRGLTVASGQALSAGTVLSEVGGKFQALALEQSISGEMLASGDGSTKVFEGVLANGGVVPGTVAVMATVGGEAKVLNDDGRGRLSAEGVGKGSVDYGSGRYWLSFDSAPDAGDITADYSHDQAGAAVAVAVLLEDIDASDGDEPGVALAHGEALGDALIWPDGLSAEQKTRALKQLAAAGIYVG